MCAKTSPSTAVLPSVPVRPQKDGAVPSWLRTDGTVDNTAGSSRANLVVCSLVRSALPSGPVLSTVPSDGRPQCFR